MLLSADQLSVSLSKKPVLHGLRFEIPPGAWVGILGPNGSGKTTLLRTISGLLPYHGTVTLWNRPVHSWKPRALARRLAFVRQNTPLTFDLSVESFVLLGRSPFKGWLEPYREDDRQRMRAALQQVALEDFGDRSVLSLSGGELQRVFLAQALVQEAELLLLDEPTTHLDVHHQFQLLTLIKRLVREGRTVLAVFHDLALAAQFTDLLLVLREGRLRALGKPAHVLTEALIAEVFRMRVALQREDDRVLRIDYLSAL